MARILFQQGMRRFPLKLRKQLRIERGYNPVTLALCLRAFSDLAEVFPQEREPCESEIRFCMEGLLRLRSEGYSGSCWGYDFDWEGRYASLPAGTPTVVATGMVIDSLFQQYQRAPNEALLEVCTSAVNFVRHDLRKTHIQGSFCYSYSPIDNQCILNASMFGVRILVLGYELTDDTELLEEARRAVAFVIKHQRSDGSWPYAVGDSRTWTDNFHTGYILECLAEYARIASDSEAHSSVRRGLEFYLRHFLTADFIPKYYHDKVYPIDSTAGAQSILTLLSFGYKDQAARVAQWMVQAMQGDDGSFYYQKHRFRTNKISYMRWSNAWMFKALARLCKVLSTGQPTPSGSTVETRKHNHHVMT